MHKELIFKNRFCNRNTYWFIVAAMLVVMSVIFGNCKTKNPKDINDNPAELDGLKVPAGFSIERAAGPGMLTFPMFASFDGQGRLFVFESDGSSPSTEEMLKKPPYHIRLLEDTDGDGIFDKSKIFADSLSFPKGGVFYKGSLYVTASPDLLRLTDTDGDGVADKREVILTGWTLNHNGALLGGPFFGPDGWMYLTDARRGFNITTKEGVNLNGSSARIWRCRPDGSGLESMCGGGYDNAVELAFMPSGETVGTMTYFIDPQAGMRDAIMHWVEGGVYPKPQEVIHQDHFKLTGDLMPVMTKLGRVAPAGLMRYRGPAFGNEFVGNLFSAEFNTGRIMRHKIFTEGATYRTVDEPFVTSTVPDIHLTDVFEDADGSLLVVNTGGWFIAGCPLSRVAKLNVPGGIYRIRKNGADKTVDPWGHDLDLKTLSTENLAKYIEDPRPVVRDNAIERLIEIGDPSVEPIRNSLLRSQNEESRSAAVFALYRINTPGAMKELRTALDDASPIVRTAAARVLGLAKNKEAIDKLAEIVQKDKAAVRRQAATALGQIGDPRAVGALLNALTDSSDRFVEHAIIYALTSLKNTAPLVEALAHTSYNVRKAAVIALDQIDGAPLHKENLVPFLASENSRLRNTGVWVASHHPEWPDIVIDFLQSRLSNTDSTGIDSSALELMVNFSGNKQLQDLIGTQMENGATPVQRKASLINVIGRSPVKEIPGVWVQSLGKMLQRGEPEIRLQVLKMIESRSIRALNDQLKIIIHDPKAPAEFRLKALKSCLRSDPKLSEGEFGMALKWLDNNNSSPVRLLASQVLGSAKLNNDQLVQLAKGQLAEVDNFLLPGLLDSFEGNSNVEVGEALVTTLGTASHRLDNLTEQDLQKLLHDYPQSVKTLAAPLMAGVGQRNGARLAQLNAVEAGLKKGDIGQGRILFYGKAICFSCHAIGNKGGDFAPDLTNIGEIRSRHDILEAILYPSASFAREYEPYKVFTKASTYTGMIKEQLPAVIIMASAPGQIVRLQRSEITGIEPDRISMMPPGLDEHLTTEELSDLVAYLTSLPDGMGGHGNEH